MSSPPPSLVAERTTVTPLLRATQDWFDRHKNGCGAVIYHADPDGAVSAAFIGAYLAKTFAATPFETYWVGTHEFDFEQLRGWVAAAKPKWVAMFDVNIVERTDILEDWQAKGIEVLIYDDHDVPTGPVPDNVTYLTPLPLRPGRAIPPCLFSALLEGSFGVQQVAALSIGLIGEYLSEDYKEVVETATLPEETLDDITKSIVSFYLIADHQQGDEGLSLLKALLLTSRQGLAQFSITKVPTLRKCREEVDEDVRRNVAAGSHWIELSDGIYAQVKRVQAKARVVGIVASALRNSRDSSVVVTYQNIGDRIVVEARRSRSLESLHLVELLHQLGTGLKLLNIGGHSVAAGMAFPQSELVAFESAAQKWLEGEADGAKP